MKACLTARQVGGGFSHTDIDLQLNYSEESSMTRDFHKVLGYSPSEARVLLTNHSPKDLLN